MCFALVTRLNRDIYSAPYSCSGLGDSCCLWPDILITQFQAKNKITKGSVTMSEDVQILVIYIVAAVVSIIVAKMMMGKGS